MKNYHILGVGFLSLFIGWSIMNGTAQEYVHFAGPENELGCAVIALSMGIISFIALDWRGLVKWLVK